MDKEEQFYSQLGKTIQAWLWVETELYFIYAQLMKGANHHLVSATFHKIQSVDSKLSLINACLSLVLDAEGEEWKCWKNLFKKALKLNKKRNKIVHEPAVISVKNGVQTIFISPSHFNSMALAKGQTTYKGPVVSAKYTPQQAKVLADHKLETLELYALERAFKDFSHGLHAFRESIESVVAEAIRNAEAEKRS